MPPLRKKTGAVKGPASIAQDLPLDNKHEAMALIIERLENLTDKNGRSISELFLELPDREDYPDYFVIIKNPLALSIIKERLNAREYEDGNIDNFGIDLRTMTTNAKTYNRDGSMVFRDATTLESYIDVAIKALKSKAKQPKKQSEEASLTGFSLDLCRRVLDTIKMHEDKDGREMAELFMELPNEEEYPDYYDEITEPISIEMIEQKIEQGVYATSESFEKDVNRMFENAKLYNAEGSRVYLDAEELQHLFWKTIGKNGRGRMTKGKRARKHDNELPEVTHQGEVYRVGDFVHLQNDSSSKPTIGLIFSIWQDEKGVQGLDAVWFLRPEHIVHPYASRFYPSEVVKASGVHEHLVTDILERCFVLQTKDFIRGRPDNWKEGQSVYVCEQRYNDSYKSVSRIKNWASCLPHGHKPGDIQLNYFPQPLVIKKLPSASRMEKPVKRDTSESVSRASTPQGTFSSYVSSREPSPTPEPPKVTPSTTSKSNKRKSAQMQLGSPAFVPAAVDKPMASPLASPLPRSNSSHHRYRCNYSNLTNKQQCAATFSSEHDLQNHVATEHAIFLNNANPPATLRRGRPKKSSSATDVNAASPSIPTTPTVPNAPAAPAVTQTPGAISSTDTNVYQQPAYNAYNTAGQYSASSQPRPPTPGQVLSGQNMYSGAQYSPSQQNQQMQYMQQSHQRMSYPPQTYGQVMQTGQSRSQGYAQSMPYNQDYGYSQSYSMQQPQHQAYSYGQNQYQPGHNQQGYTAHQQSAYSQPYSQPYSTHQHAYSQQQQQQGRHIPAQIPSQNPIDHQQQQFAQQQQRLAQQQQLVHQQYLAQQQLAQQQIQHQQQAQNPSSFHQRSLSQPYAPQSPLSIIASQPYASMNPPYQQQSYAPPTSLAYSSSGHTHSLSNASSHGSVSTVTNAMEGVGLGLTGVTGVDHGRIMTSTVSSAGVYSVKGDGFGNGDKNQGSMFTSPLMESTALPLPKPQHSAEYMTNKRQRTESGMLLDQTQYDGSNIISSNSIDTNTGDGNSMNPSNSMGINNGGHIVGAENHFGNGSASVVLPGINALTRDVEVGQ
ncbi:hypothetical protein BGZ49_009503 [Haplosporangium sp. Z 27]|nr:hypothetical protein BGZ49_009503 [Haplosporangium sp. Z 27]